MICTRCGNTVPEKDNFCTSCGKPVSEIVEEIRKRENEEKARKKEEEKEAKRLREEEKAKYREEHKEEILRKRKSIILVSVIGIILVAGIVTFFVVKDILHKKELERIAKEEIIYNQMQEQQHQYRVSLWLNNYRDEYIRSLVEKLNEEVYYDLERHLTIVSQSTVEFVPDVFFNSETLDEIIRVHEDYHLKKMPYGSEDYEFWLYYVDKKTELTTKCPICTYAKRNKDKNLYENPKKYLTGDLSFSQFFGVMGFQKNSFIPNVQNTVKEAKSFALNLEKYSRVLENPLVSIVDLKTALVENVVLGENKYKVRPIRIIGKLIKQGEDYDGLLSFNKKFRWVLSNGKSGWGNEVNCFFDTPTYGDIGSQVMVVGSVYNSGLDYSLTDCRVEEIKTFKSPSKFDVKDFAFPIENLYLRASASKTGKKLGKIDEKSIVQVLQIGPADKISGLEGNWCKVKVLSGPQVIDVPKDRTNSDQIVKGTDGWCFGGYLYNCGYNAGTIIVNGIEYKKNQQEKK